MAASLMSPRKTSVIGALLVALGPISMALYTPALPQLVQVFGTEVATVKLTLTVYFLGFALAQLICGPLSDAFGRRPIVLAFTGCYLLGSLIAVFAPSVEWLLAARVIQGVGAAAGVAISRAIVRDLFTGRDSIRVMNTIGLMLAAGPALSPTIGGVLLDLSGWHAIFVAMVLYGLLVLAVFLTVVPETLASRNPESARPGRLIANYAALFADTRFLRPSIVMACSVGSLYTLATILPFVLIGSVGLSPTQFGVGMLAQSGSFMLGSLVMSRLLRATEAHRLTPVGLAFMAIGAACLPVLHFIAAPSFLTVMGPVGLFAFGIPFVMPSMLTESLAPFPQIAGAAAALSGFLQMTGGLLGSAAAAVMGSPSLALTTIVPVMAALLLAANFGLRSAATRNVEAAADRLLEPAAPAE